MPDSLDDPPRISPVVIRVQELERLARERLERGEKPQYDTGKDAVKHSPMPESVEDKAGTPPLPAAPALSPEVAGVVSLFDDMRRHPIDLDFGSVSMTVEALGWAENETIVAFFMRGPTSLRMRDGLGRSLIIRRSRAKPDLEVVTIGGELTFSDSANLRLWVFIKKQVLADRLATS